MVVVVVVLLLGHVHSWKKGAINPSVDRGIKLWRCVWSSVPVSAYVCCQRTVSLGTRKRNMEDEKEVVVVVVVMVEAPWRTQ